MGVIPKIPRLNLPLLVYLGWTQSTDDVDPQYAIEYEIYGNGVLSPLPVSAGVDQDFVYASPECVNTFVVKAVGTKQRTYPISLGAVPVSDWIRL